MSDLTSSLATLAERLGGRPETARVQHGVADGASPPGVVDLTGILAMPLDRFAREGQCLEVHVPWLDVTLWFVPEERDAEALARDGVSRGRVWTATELMDIMAIGERTSEALRTIALAKLAFDGDIAAVRLRVRSGPAADPDQESAETTRAAAAPDASEQGDGRIA